MRRRFRRELSALSALTWSTTSLGPSVRPSSASVRVRCWSERLSRIGRTRCDNDLLRSPYFSSNNQIKVVDSDRTGRVVFHLGAPVPRKHVASEVWVLIPEMVNHMTIRADDCCRGMVADTLDDFPCLAASSCSLDDFHNNSRKFSWRSRAIG